MQENNKIITSEIINSNIITNESYKKKFIKKGEKILQENEFFNDLDFIMSNDSFRVFYEKYFKDFTDVKIVLLYMKLYETIETEYRDRHGMEIEKELLAYMIKEIMNDSISRKNVFESFHKFIENDNPKNKKYILDLFNYKEDDYGNKKYIKNF
jgi:hypothetical protein